MIENKFRVYREMIQCREIYNCSCLRCSEIHQKMIRIGAYYFCYDCWMEVFGGQENFKPDSEYGKQYYKWLQKYKDPAYKIPK